MVFYKFKVLEANPRVELYFEFMEEDLSRYIRRNKKVSRPDVKVDPT